MCESVNERVPLQPGLAGCVVPKSVQSLLSVKEEMRRSAAELESAVTARHRITWQVVWPDALLLWLLLLLLLLLLRSFLILRKEAFHAKLLQ